MLVNQKFCFCYCKMLQDNLFDFEMLFFDIEGYYVIFMKICIFLLIKCEFMYCMSCEDCII